MVTKGCLQIPGVDCTESFAPVATDTTIRLPLAMALCDQNKDWTVECLDIEAACLEGDVDEPIYIEFPEGMDELGFATGQEMHAHCVELGKSMCGNVDAALRFFRTLKEHLTKNVGMKNSKTDPCVFYLKDDNSETKLTVASHADDCTMAGTKDAMEQFKLNVKTRFNVTDLGLLKKHLGIWCDWKEEENGEKHIAATMPKLAGETIESFEEHMARETKMSKVPGTPGETSPKAKEEEKELHAEKHGSIVGKMMHLVTEAFVEGANPARELSKHFQKPAQEHWKELERFVGCLKGNQENVKITHRKPRELRPMAVADSNHATNADDRRSVTGAIFHCRWNNHELAIKNSKLSDIVERGSQACRNGSSSTRSKIHSTTARGNINVHDSSNCTRRQHRSNVPSKEPTSYGQRTKQISIRAHFIRDLWSQGHLDAQFVRSKVTHAQRT
jgi:hypothetical protein